MKTEAHNHAYEERIAKGQAAFGDNTTHTRVEPHEEVSGTRRESYTPGPWEVFTPIGDGDYGILSKGCNAGGNFYVASLPNGSHPEARANAHLLAAAPDLLQACIDALADTVDELAYPDGPCLPRETRNALRAAIAKAQQ